MRERLRVLFVTHALPLFRRPYLRRDLFIIGQCYLRSQGRASGEGHRFARYRRGDDDLRRVHNVGLLCGEDLGQLVPHRLGCRALQKCRFAHARKHELLRRFPRAEAVYLRFACHLRERFAAPLRNRFRRYLGRHFEFPTILVALGFHIGYMHGSECTAARPVALLPRSAIMPA